ncbi:MAG TPA: hypothetical protein VHW45_05215 [Candidatus Sulfotelmatobacter sp.]|nr:hypothetical protein [Candidatus Sulfotelmatobacter sp.]
MKTGRRMFVGGSGLALAGTITGFASGASAEAAPSTGTKVANFGWELSGLHGNGANAFFEVKSNLTLTAAEIDLALMITSVPHDAGFAEVLVQGSVSIGGPPKFGTDARAPVLLSRSSHFGLVEDNNPYKLTVFKTGHIVQDMFCSVILKSWVTRDGTASSTDRHIRITPSFALNAGDFIAFHMDHAGVPVDCELQAVFEYELR